MFDCARPAVLARFWAEVLGYRVRPYSEKDLAWLRDHGFAGPEDDPSVAIDPPDDRLPTIWFNWATLADPDGNEFCVFPPREAS